MQIEIVIINVIQTRLGIGKNSIKNYYYLVIRSSIVLFTEPNSAVR